jgi:hypothetical protein
MQTNDDDREAQLVTFLAKMRAKEDAENGPGAFDRCIARGKLLIEKRADELTPSERDFLRPQPGSAT